MRKQIGIAAAVALMASFALTGPAANAAPATLAGDGSSYSKNIITLCAANFTAANPGSNITYLGGGSGNGKKAFIAKTVDFAGSDSAFSATDKPAPYTYVPVVGGPIAIPFNVSGVSALKLSPGLIGQIFNGTITKWNDKNIVALNKGVKLPNKTISVVYRSSGSGTTNNFAAYLVTNKVAGWTQNDSFDIAAGKLPATKVGAANSAAVATAIDNTGYSIGYVDLSDAYNKDLSFASLRNTYKDAKTKKTMIEYVKPSVAAAQKFLALQSPGADGFVKINHTKTVKGGYNLSLLTYLIAPTEGGSSSKAASVKEFVTYVLNTCAPAKAKGLYYVPISGSLLTKARTLVAKIG